MMEEVARVVAETLGVEHTGVLELSRTGDELRLVAGVGWEPGTVRRARHPGGARPSGRPRAAHRAPDGHRGRVDEPAPPSSRRCCAGAAWRAASTVQIAGRDGPWGALDGAQPAPAPLRARTRPTSCRGRQRRLGRGRPPPHRGGGPPRGAARRAHRAAEPHAGARPPGGRAGAPAPRRARRRRAAARPRPVQARQRLLRARDRRRPAGDAGAAAAGRGAAVGHRRAAGRRRVPDRLRAARRRARRDPGRRARRPGRLAADRPALRRALHHRVDRDRDGRLAPTATPRR